ncbi:MAG: NUDIX hydrolase [Thiohalospira sp.]
MYKVFYNQRTVFFVNGHKHLNEKDQNRKHFFKNRSQLHKILVDFSNNENIKELYIIHPDIEFVFTQFSSLFTIIEAAGGLVKTHGQKFLAIFRRGKWDLPKGKLEKAESPETGAIREVEEECGISGIQLKKQLTITYHTYFLTNHHILKKTYWYEMFHSGAGKLKPQTEEEITDVRWLNAKDTARVINNTFPSIIEVLKSGGVIS